MQVKIEKLVYGGNGLARTEGGVVFLPHTAPGDVAEIELVQRKADYATGRVLSLLEPSPDRQTPSCPNYDSVGCCHWEHIRYSKQLEIKESILRETLARIGKIDWRDNIRVIRGPDRNYRLRATFHVRDRRVGFIAEGTHTVVPIRECAALAPPLNDFIHEANSILESPEMARVREIRVVTEGGASAPLAASFISEDGEVHHRQFGAEPPRVAVDGFLFGLHPDAFFQSNRFLLHDFLNEVLDQAGPTPEYVLDLFCGSGFFSIPIARRGREVLGLESNPAAIRQGRMNARLNSVSNVRFFKGSVENSLEGAELRPDLVLLNPPRTGCGRKTTHQIAALHAKRVVYVSCNPSTFAREVPAFIEEGYVLEKLTLLDQFPNTYHIESIASLKR
jgi:23S rRNA (uracil1939-C5)-methyltransferase